MAENNKGTGNPGEGVEEGGSENQDKTFTQDELNEIIKKRLARADGEHQKAIEELQAKIAELTADGQAAGGQEDDDESTKLADALKRIEELEGEKEAAAKAAERQAKLDEVLKKYSIEAEYADLLEFVPDDKLDEKAELLGKRFAEPSKNERANADVKAPDDELKKWAAAFVNSK